MAVLFTALMFIQPNPPMPTPEAVAWAESTGQIVMVDGEWVENTQDLWAYLGINHWEHANVWHNEDGRDGRFGGGLQIYPATWQGQGCDEFAPAPAQALINDQIICGRRIQASGGWGQWPVSSRRVGL